MVPVVQDFVVQIGETAPGAVIGEGPFAFAGRNGEIHHVDQGFGRQLQEAIHGRPARGQTEEEWHQFPQASRLGDVLVDAILVRRVVHHRHRGDQRGRIVATFEGPRCFLGNVQGQAEGAVQVILVGLDQWGQSVVQGWDRPQFFHTALGQRFGELRQHLGQPAIGRGSNQGVDTFASEGFLGLFGVDQRVWIHRRHGLIQHPIERADQGVVVAIGEIVREGLVGGGGGCEDRQQKTQHGGMVRRLRIKACPWFGLEVVSWCCCSWRDAPVRRSPRRTRREWQNTPCTSL